MTNSNVFLVVADKSKEFTNALKCAVSMAVKCGGRIEILKIIQPAPFQYWDAVTQQLESQQRKAAEDVLWTLAEDASREFKCQTPMFIFNIQRGAAVKMVRKTINENSSISALVLAGSTSKPNPLIKYFTKKGLNHINVPVIIVPQNKDS